MNAGELLEAACESGIACLSGREVLLTVAAQGIVSSTCIILESSLPNGTDGTPYSQNITANLPATFLVIAGALPDGLSLHANGLIDGTPTLANTYDFTVRATTAQGTCTRDFSIIIIPNEPPVFEPPQLADLILWLKPDSLSGLSDGNPVSIWPDSGIHGNDIDNAVDPTYRLNQIGGVPGVDFDGVDDKMDNSSFTTVSTEYTMFVVLKFDSATGTECPVRVGENGGYGFQKAAGNRDVLHRLVADCVDGAATTSAELWSAVRTSAPLLRFFLNGVAQVITNSTSNVNAPDGTVHIGRFGALGFYFAGIICEVLIYEVPLGDTDRETVENYLIAKYGL